MMMAKDTPFYFYLLPHHPMGWWFYWLCLVIAHIPTPIMAGAIPVQIQGQTVPSLAPMLAKVTPAVVNIATTGEVRTQENPLLSDPFFQQFFKVPKPRRKVVRSLGSGVVMDSQQGLILTNDHVINKANRISVTLQDGRTVAANRVGADPETDIAVVRVQVEGLTALPFGNSDQLRVGDFVVAIGNPFGLGQTVTSGIISALGRGGLGIEGYEDFIQTDASINPGNSGGALVTLTGELAGINTAILAPSGGNVGIGFAIPANMAHSVMQQLTTHGAIRRGLLGVQTQDITSDLAQAFGTNHSEGALVTLVTPATPAERAGLVKGDIIIETNGKPIHNSQNLRTQVGLAQVGDPFAIKVIRNGQTIELKTNIDPPTIDNLDGGSLDNRLQGAIIANNNQEDAKGILITEVKHHSPAWRLGLRDGDRIMSLNRVPLQSVADLQHAIQKDERNLLINIQRDEQEMVILVR